MLRSRRHAHDLDWKLIDAAPDDPLPRPPRPTRPARWGAPLLALLAIAGPLAGLAFGRAAARTPVADPAPATTTSAPALAAALLDPPAATVGRTSDVEFEGFELRLTSQDGRWEAWAEPLAPDASIYAPGGRTETTLVIRDKLSDEVTALTFERNLEPEAFSSDGRTLFTIDHRPAATPEIYRVTALDVPTAELRDVFGPRKVPLFEEMRGEGRQQVWAPSNDQLYTLYVRQTHAHVEGTHDHAGGAGPYTETAGTDAFVHVLDVDAEWALCLALPLGFGLGEPGSTDIMLTNDGNTVTVVDHDAGQRVDIDRGLTADGVRDGFSVNPPTLLAAPAG